VTEVVRDSTPLSLLKLIWRTDRGAALVESAIILPVFLTLVGGIYEFGFFLYQQQLVTSGVRDAARYLTLTADPTSSANQIEAKNLAVSGSIDGGATRVSGWSASDVIVAIDSVDNSAGTYSGGSTIQIVTVSTSFLDPSLGFLNLLGVKAPTIAVSHQERFVGGSAPGQG
jgi:Flp pilus assembly protein TadG